MSNPTSAAKSPPTVPPTYHPLPAVLSYLVPGLGLIYEGRIGKGILFFVCIYGLFFYGMYLGSWSNVYLPDTAEANNPWGLPRVLANLYNRPQFAGQFWVGVAAWPAVVQYLQYDPAQETGPLLGDLERIPYENRASAPGVSRGPNTAPHDWPGKTLNELQTNGDKTWDLGWVYTVIAGVLNIMVIYDALTGPAFLVGKADAAGGPATKEAARHAHAPAGG